MSDTKAAILTALKQLDPANADHWTGDGAPRLDVLAKLMKVSNVKRGDVTEAAPHFTKDNPTLEAPAAQGGESTSGQGADAAPTPPADDEAQQGSGEGDEGGEGAGDGDQDPPADDEGDEGDEGDEDEGDLLPGDEELDEAEAAVLAAKAKLDEAQAAADAAKKVVLEAQAEHDKLVEARDSARSPHADMEERLAFIKRQQENRARRAGVSTELLKGINVDQLDPRSPLDRSMARKKGFGHRGRPQVPLKTGG